MAGERGEIFTREGRAEPEPRGQTKKKPAQNFTFGAASASGEVVVNSAIGFSLE